MSAADGVSVGGVDSSLGGGEAPRVRGSCAVLRGSGVREDADRVARSRRSTRASARSSSGRIAFSRRCMRAQAPSHGDTTYFCTADSSGMMVSIIQSNYSGMGSRADGGWARVHVPESRLAVCADGRASERVRAPQAAVPHDHSRVCGEGRRAVARVRRDGWRHAAAGAGAGDFEHGGFRARASGGGRCAALAPRREH